MAASPTPVTDSDASSAEEASASSDHSSGHDEHVVDTKIKSPPGTYTMADFA